MRHDQERALWAALIVAAFVLAAALGVFDGASR